MANLAKPLSPAAALQELRDLVGTYLEGSDDAPRAAELLDALGAIVPKPTPQPMKSPADPAQEKYERGMFGCAAASIDEALARCREPRDVAMFAMGVLSDAQELILRGRDGWYVAPRDADTIRQRMNVAKYAIDKAVPR